MRKTKLFAIIFLIGFSFLMAIGHTKAPMTNVDVTVKQISPFAYCCLPAKGPYSNIEKAIGQLIPTMETQRIFPTGLTHYTANI